MKRTLLLAATTVPTLVATDRWRAPYALVAVCLVAGVSWVVGAVAWPRRPKTWHRPEVQHQRKELTWK